MIARTTAVRIVGIALLAAASHAQAALYSSMFVFGDSNSDSGRRLALEGIPGAPYYQGRHSNGPVAVEVMAGQLGLNQPATFSNYAVGGALSGFGNVDSNPVVAQTGLLDQFNTFKGGHPTADSSSLYFIWGGDNDINNCMGATRDQCSSSQLDAVVANIDTLIGNLVGLGARHFMVMGLYGGGANKQTFRTNLGSNLAALDASLNDADILYFNPRALLLNMIAPENPYGFTHMAANDPCYTGDFFSGTPGTLCANPDQYVFWDTRGHLTGRTHQVFGDSMALAIPNDQNAVPEPEPLSLIGLGLASLVALRGGRAKKVLRSS